jgi:hypothetical protein
LAVAVVAGFAALRPKGKPAEDKDKVKTAKAELGDVRASRLTPVDALRAA